MISDPKALQHVYSDSNAFGRKQQTLDFMKLMLGPGLLAVDGDDHKRQRRVLQPAFSIGPLKALFPVFMRHSQKVCMPKLSVHTILIIMIQLLSTIKKEVESRGGSRSVTINVYNYMARATLDIICDGAYSDYDPVPETDILLAAFGYEIGSLDHKMNSLRDAFHELE